MQKLYSQCLETANIEKAIHTVYSHEGAKTAGADGISKSSNITQERIVKEVKLRLRRYKSVQSRKVHIPKGNGEFRELTIINLFDRIAQQAVYQIISPLLEGKMSKHSYGFRKGIGAKVPVSRLADILLHQKETYTVELDFKKCFDNIPLDKAIGCLKEMGIKNFQLLRTIKHLMWTSKEYSGVGLSQGTVLGPLLANCYLTKLDNFIEQTFEINKRDTAYTQNHKLHKDEWIQWNLKRGKKICCRYYRYADDTLITCHNEAEQRFIVDAISSFINQNLEIEINQVKSHYQHNEIHFLGFALIKSKRSIWILFDNPKEYTDRLKRFKLYTYTQCQAFMKWFRGFGNVYQYGEGREKISIDIYALRKTTKTSYKEYLIGSKWLERVGKVEK
ncbi:MAG: group II intron reverse transcriptase domain-containing protein [Selenomonadaceae bacterium]|nr:group II intron reverse transcriptase domain-containing protein [Selenomonadaceae bacterium]